MIDSMKSKYIGMCMLLRFLAVMLIGKTNALLLRSYTLQHLELEYVTSGLPGSTPSFTDEETEAQPA